MRTLKTITEDIEGINQVKGLIGVYEEIAALKMQAIRSSVTASTEYFEGLSRISTDVALDLSAGLSQGGKDAAIFLSADSGLYGDLVDRVLVSFVDFVNKNSKVDVFVTGALGVSLVKMYAPSLKFETLSFPTDKETGIEEDIKSILGKLWEYKNVSIFHGRFQSLVAQGPAASNMGALGLEGVGTKFDQDEAKRIQLKNLYEPTVEAVGEKFSKEISASIFNQSVRENQLSKYAARLIHLDSALENIDQKLVSYDKEKQRARKKLEQKKQTERTSRIWLK